MDDLEMVRKCAAAMGLREFREPDEYQTCTALISDAITKRDKRVAYWPLTDDAQAMALLCLLLSSGHRVVIENNAMKGILYGKKPILCLDDKHLYDITDATQFRRAIVECVAKMEDVK